MTINQLRYALMLKKHGSFKKAASSLHISQPGLSTQIAKLEKEVGIVLFDRSKNPIQTSTEGDLFLKRAQEIILSTDELKSFAENLSQKIEGRLRIGVIPTLGPFLVPLFSHTMRQSLPKLDLDINEMITEEVVNGVKSGDLDAGIISTPALLSGISSNPIFYERFFFYFSELPAHNTFSIKDIDYDQLWLLNEGNCFRDQINNFCDLKRVRKNKKFIYRSNSIDALIRIVDNQGGITILPELTTLLLDEQQEERLYPVKQLQPKAREISLITRSRNIKESSINELNRFIRASIPSHMLSSEGLDIVDPNIKFD